MFCSNCRKKIEPMMIAYLEGVTSELEQFNRKLLAMPSNVFGITLAEPKLCITCREKWEKHEIGKGVRSFKPRCAKKRKRPRETTDMFAEDINSKTDQPSLK